MSKKTVSLLPTRWQTYDFASEVANTTPNCIRPCKNLELQCSWEILACYLNSLFSDYGHVVSLRVTVVHFVEDGREIGKSHHPVHMEAIPDTPEPVFHSTTSLPLIIRYTLQKQCGGNIHYVLKDRPSVFSLCQERNSLLK